MCFEFIVHRHMLRRLTLFLALIHAFAAVAFFDVLDPRAAQIAAEARIWTVRFNTMGAIGTNDAAVRAYVRDELNVNDPVFTYALGCALHEAYTEKPPRNGISNIFASLTYVTRVAPDKWLRWLAQHYEKLDPRARATALGTMRYSPCPESYLILHAALADANEVPMEVTNPIPYWPIRVGDIAYSWLCMKLAERDAWPLEYDRWLVVSPTHPIATRDEMFARLDAWWRTNSPAVLSNAPPLAPPAPATLAALVDKIRRVAAITNTPPPPTSILY
jgi:hypothetical protein